jgi:hypothetical protein
MDYINIISKKMIFFIFIALLLLGVLINPESAQNVENMGSSEQIVSTSYVSSSRFPITPFFDEEFSVTKRILNLDSDNFFINDSIFLLVEIKYRGPSELHSVEIWEQPDKNLKIINSSCPYVTNSIAEIFRPERYLTWECRSNEPYLNYSFSTLKTAQSIVYLYSIKGLKSGSFNTYTVVRKPYFEGSKDYYYKLPIAVRDISPQFQFLFEVSKITAEQNEPVPITYRIKYLGGTPNNPCNYTIIVDESDRYKLDRQVIPNQSFSKNIFKAISVTARYEEPGVYGLPGIQVADQHFTPPQYITISSSSERYINTTTISIASALIAFLSLLANIYIQRLDLPLKPKMNPKPKR